MGVKLCIEAGCLQATHGTRCPDHERAYQQARNADPRRKPRRTRAYMDTVIVGACMCCGTTEDLTRHHVSPLAADTPGPTFMGRVVTGDAIVPMCRRCNSSIGIHRMADHRCPLHGGERL